MTSLTRGPLPAHVYWRRRLVVLGVPLLLVVVLARVLGAGSDGSSEAADGAAVVAADEAPASTGEPAGSDTAAPTTEGQPGPGTRKKKRKQKEPEPVLAEPDGRCSGEDIAVTPAVDRAVAGRDVAVVLALRTLTAEACTWRVSPRNLTVKITSGKDDIWTSQECRRAIPRSDVVVRRAVTTEVTVTWDAKRSDATCSRLTEWALPGWYHVAAAALAGEPSDVQFELETPVAPVVTKTAKPRRDSGSADGGRASDRD